MKIFFYPARALLMKYRQSEIGSFFFKSVLDTQNVVYIKNVQTKLLEVKKVKVGCFLVGQGTKRAENANIWPKMTKNAHFGPNLAVFGPNILIPTGGGKSFGTHVTENHPGTLFASFLVGHNANIWPKKPILVQIWPFKGRKS